MSHEPATHRGRWQSFIGLTYAQMTMVRFACLEDDDYDYCTAATATPTPTPTPTTTDTTTATTTTRCVCLTLSTNRRLIRH